MEVPAPEVSPEEVLQWNDRYLELCETIWGTRRLLARRGTQQPREDVAALYRALSLAEAEIVPLRNRITSALHHLLPPENYGCRTDAARPVAFVERHRDLSTG